MSPSHSTPAFRDAAVLVAALLLGAAAFPGAAVAQAPATPTAQAAPRSESGSAAATPPAPPAERKRIDPTAPAKTQYQNVKVMTGCSASELHDAMDFIEGALGVGCGYCHVRPFDKDEKPAKQTAREMIRMVEAINRDNFDGKPVVTCATCHQGRPKPLAVAALEAPPTLPQAFVPDRAERDEGAAAPEGGDAAPFPPPGPVLARFVEALGGRPALDDLRGLRMSATQGEGERQLALQLAWRPPASMLTALTVERRGRTLEFAQGSDGREAWSRRDQAPAEVLHGLDRARALADAELLPAWLFSKSSGEFETLGTGRVDGRPVVVLRTTSADGLEQRLHFDAGSGLLVRRAYEVPTPLGPVPRELDYADWREEAGVLIPHRIVTRQPGESTTMTIDRVDAASDLFPSTFARPTTAARSGAPGKG